MTQAQELQSLLGGDDYQTFLGDLEALLPPEHYKRLARILELIGWLLGVLDQKNLSILKLRKLLFGPQTEKSKQPGPVGKNQNKARGHGRNSHHDYTGAKRVDVSHPVLKAGDPCLECGRGKLRALKEPAIAIHLKAQPPVTALIHQMERLRCDACGKVFSAPIPHEAGTEKYDPSVGVMSALMRYGSGMPFYRLEQLQKALGVPLPYSVQWEQVVRIAEDLKAIFECLILRAAQSCLFFSDDTTMRINTLRKQIQSDPKSKRKGIFTTAIHAEHLGVRIVLFFTGGAHAGENLTEVLQLRQPGLSPPLHMCDGLDRNIPKDHPTVPCQCNVHARRNFVEIQNAFPEESAFVIDSLARIYQNEGQAKQMDCQKRLEFHQIQSRPIMDRLHDWLEDQTQNTKAEPNSTLGGAIGYMRDRWEQLTQFLKIPGAPLDNNVAERILKMSILHRKNSLFYRTQNGAHVGDIFMSLIQTCRANGINPFDYMLAVVKNAKQANASPEHWLPWNFHLNPSETTSS